MFLTEEIAIRINIISGTVDITLSQQAENSIHHTIVSLDILIIGENGLRHKLCNTDLLHVCVIDKGLLDILHIGTATCQDDAAQ